MIPVFQGNKPVCLQACIASLLNKALCEVPDFVGIYEVGWFAKMKKWLNKIGIDACFVEQADIKKYWYNRDYIGLLRSESIRKKNGPFHAIVARNEEIIHDPNGNDNKNRKIEFAIVLKTCS